jgi:hypothetical protein
MLKQKPIVSLFILMAIALGVATNTLAQKQATFTVRIENISKSELITTGEAKYPFALSPGLFIVSKDGAALFKVGGKAGAGLEAQAEDGNPEVLAKELMVKYSSNQMGVFNTPIGANGPAPLLPGFASGSASMMTTGGAFEFTFTATKGMKLNLIAMYGQSNDLFYAPEKAIDLFVKGEALNGDITDKLQLWDAGTEVNQAPGIGADQAPRQKAANTGTSENGVVKTVSDGFKYPETKSVLRVTITPVN